MAIANKIQFTFRHLVHNITKDCAKLKNGEVGNSDYLQGYALAIDVVEYAGHDTSTKDTLVSNGIDNTSSSIKLQVPVFSALNMTDLGYQALQATVNSKNPMQTLMMIAENPPLVATALSSLKPLDPLIIQKANFYTVSFAKGADSVCRSFRTIDPP
jgi:hypothetical protein